MRTVTLGDYIEILSGFAFKSSLFNSEARGLPLVRIRDVVPGYSETYSDEDFDEKYLLEDGDLLIGMDGEFNCARWKGGKALLNQRVCRVIASSKNLDDQYLFYFLPRPLKQIEAKSNFVTVKHLSVKQIQAIKIPLPPLEEQRRIAAILDKADGVRRKRKEAIRLTEELLKSTFLEMFGDPVTNPKGWEICKIGKITDVKTGKTPSREDEENYGGDIRWVKTTEVRELIIKETEEFLTKKGASQVSIFPKNTILIAMYGQGATRGRTALLGLPCATNQACAAIMPSEKYAPFYLWTLLRLSYERLRELGRGGNQPNLNLSMVKNFLIPMPPLEKQIYFQNIVLNLQSQRQKMDLNLQYHDNLFNSLLQKAFRGEL